MTSFGWDALGVGLAAGLGVGFIAVTAFARRKRTPRGEPAHAPGSGQRRIDVVAIDEPIQQKERAQ
jgi:hypothetical protein